MKINMNNKFVRFICTAFTFFMGNVLSKLVAFILIPIYTSYLSPEQFGNYDLTVSVVSLMVPLIYMQVWDGVFRFTFDNKSSDSKQKVITNGFIIILIASIAYFFIGSVIHIVKKDLFTLWSITYGAMLALQYQYTVISRVHLNNFIFSVSGVVNTLITAILNIVMITKWNMGIDSLYIASIIGILVQIILIENIFKPIKKMKLSHIDISLMMKLMKFSIPLCVSTVAYWLLNGFSKMWIYENLNTSANGLFAVANKFSGLILLAVGVVQFAWNEMIYMSVNSEDNNLIYEKGIRFTFKITMLSSCFVIFGSKLLFPLLVDIKYYEAIYIIPITIIGVVANSFASFTATIFLANKKSSIVFITTIISVLANISLCIIYRDKLNLIGVLSILSLALVLLTVSRLIGLNRLYKINLEKESIVALIVFLSSCIVYHFVYTNAHLIMLMLIYAFLSLYLSKREILQLLIVLKKKMYRSNSIES